MEYTTWQIIQSREANFLSLDLMKSDIIKLKIDRPKNNETKGIYSILVICAARI